MSVSVCLFVFLSVYLFVYFKNHTSKFTKFSVHVYIIVLAQSFSDGNTIRYVLPVV